MAIPHTILKQQIRKRLKGLEGRSKIAQIRLIQGEMVGYLSGPYGEIRKWLQEEIDKTKTRSKIKKYDWLGIKRQGERQFMLVGCPSVGKSSLIHELSGLQTKIAAYDFTTLKPIPSVIKLFGAYIQIVDLPGLIKGATDDVGRGHRLIAMIKDCDGILLLHDLTKNLDTVDSIVDELKIAKIEKPIIVIGNKMDLPNSASALDRLKDHFKDYKVIEISTYTHQGFDQLKEEIWKVSGLLRAYPDNDSDPVILEKGSKIKDFIIKIHKDLLKDFQTAIISGPSAKFNNQHVGLEHYIKDGDHIKIVSH